MVSFGEPCHRFRRQQRVTAGSEERGIAPDGVMPQQFAPDIDNRLLVIAGGGRHRRAVTLFRQREAVAVDLAVGQMRERGHQHVAGWTHERRQPRRQRIRQRRQVRLPAVVVQDIGDEGAGRQIIRPYHHHRLLHRRVLTQGGLNFAQLDPETTNLDLMVDAPQIIEGAVLAIAGQIAGTVQSGARLVAQRMDNKPAGGLLRLVDVPGRYPDTADAQLARHADRHRLLEFVQNPHLGVRHWATDVDTPFIRVQFGVGDADGGLGRAVGVEEAAAATPFAQQIDAACLAGDDQHFQRRQRRIGQGRQRRCG